MPTNARNASSFLKQKLEDDGFRVATDVKLCTGVRADLLAEKDDKKYLIEIKTSRTSFLNLLSQVYQIDVAPDIHFVYIAAPEQILQEDLLEFAKGLRIGVISMSESGIRWVTVAQAKPPAHLSGGYNYPSEVLQGQIFPVKISVSNDGGKIALNTEVVVVPARPFRIRKGEKSRRFLGNLMPGSQKEVNFRIEVEAKAKPGRYILFVKRTADYLEPDTNSIRIEVAVKGPEQIARFVASIASELSGSISNINRALQEIDSSVTEGYLDITDNVVDKSIWNTIGLPCLGHGLYKQAEVIYTAMLETIRKYEGAHEGTSIPKGLAFHNLGIALYYQGKHEEARKNFAAAYEEDRRIHGDEKAKESLAKKALDQMLFKPISG